MDALQHEAREGKEVRPGSDKKERGKGVDRQTDRHRYEEMVCSHAKEAGTPRTKRTTICAFSSAGYLSLRLSARGLAVPSHAAVDGPVRASSPLAELRKQEKGGNKVKDKIKKRATTDEKKSVRSSCSFKMVYTFFAKMEHSLKISRNYPQNKWNECQKASRG